MGKRGVEEGGPGNGVPQPVEMETEAQLKVKENVLHDFADIHKNIGGLSHAGQMAVGEELEKIRKALDAVRSL